MVHSSLALSTLLLLPSILASGLYSKSSPVLQLDARTYHSHIALSNHTSIVEFYAPWCGHCKNLQPQYEKAARSLAGLAKVAAVNCDEESNKRFCGEMGVQGFPTLKIVRPGKKKGKPFVEDYKGERAAKAIVDAVVEKIPNHVKRLSDKDYEAWLEEGVERPKAILFTEKGTVSALLKALAVDFLGVMDVAQIRNKESEAVEVFGVKKFPTLILLPGDGKDPITYEGEMKKEGMLAFLSQAAEPNPDPAPNAKKAKTSSTDEKKADRSSSAFSKASASHKSGDSASSRATQTSKTLEDESNPTESPSSEVEHEHPVKVPDVAPPIQSLPDGLSLQQKCLNTKAGACILALLPEELTAEMVTAIAGLSEIHHKHEQAKRKLFPFYQVPSTNSQGTVLRTELGLSADTVEILAVNGKRKWHRRYPEKSFSQVELEIWIDAIRMGEGSKQPLPDQLVMPAEDLPAEPVKIDLGSGPQPGESEGDFKERMEGKLPEGVELEMEETNDEAYEKLMQQAMKATAKGAQPSEPVQQEAEEQGDEGHDEL